jgi:hypothetical protein
LKPINRFLWSFAWKHGHIWLFDAALSISRV